MQMRTSKAYIGLYSFKPTNCLAFSACALLFTYKYFIFFAASGLLLCAAWWIVFLLAWQNVFFLSEMGHAGPRSSVSADKVHFGAT